MVYVPYGDLSEPEPAIDAEAGVAKETNDAEFFFSGGDSNRDYLSLIEIFRKFPSKLVIVCSVRNMEVNEETVPPNITVLRDISSESFDSYIRASRACIIPIAHNTGAAGQSCLLRYMKYRKIVIATDTGIIREYITDGQSGILVKDNCQAMTMAIRAVDENIDSYQNYGDAAFERYIKVFSGQAIAQRLDQMINENMEGV
jgi:glycosyltransferase involved in cell wall biosynthesis